jgi:hypothetical protein
MHSPHASQIIPNPLEKGRRLAAGLEIAGVLSASRLERPAALTVSCGIAEVDALTGGLPRGALTEICGLPSSGRSSLMLAALAEATRRQEICALVDATDSFDPLSAADAGVDLERMLWIRIGAAGGFPAPLQGAPNRETDTAPRRQQGNSDGVRALEQTLKVTDLLLQAAGFGMVIVDLADLPAEVTRRIPLASWFRFRRAVEHTATVLLVIEQEAHAKTCASLVLRTAAASEPKLCPTAANPAPSYGQVLRGFDVQVEMVRARTEEWRVASCELPGKAVFTAEDAEGAEETNLWPRINADKRR